MKKEKLVYPKLIKFTRTDIQQVDEAVKENGTNFSATVRKAVREFTKK